MLSFNLSFTPQPVALRRGLEMAAALAPPHGSGADGAESGSDSPLSESLEGIGDVLAFNTPFNDPAITFTLRWSISGTIIPDSFTFIFIHGVVEELNSGLIPGVPPSHEAGDGTTYVIGARPS